MLDSRRRFNSRERAALYLLAGGKCSICGVDLEAGWHADHVMPWIRHGQTDVINGQALCPTCNLKKGNSVVQLRQWQQECIDRFYAHGDTDFLVCATPGAGKTSFSLELASRLLKAGTVKRVAVVVPTDSLRTQWCEAASRFGIDLNPVSEETGYDKAGYHGFVATYSQLSRAGGLLARRTMHQPTIAFIDEIHHAGDNKAWGDGLVEALEKATMRVALSGTPWRNDKSSPIPFVQYSADGKVQVDYDYEYGRAVADGVCRGIEFHAYDGEARWIDCGKPCNTTMGEDLRISDIPAVLDAILDPDQEWMSGVLTDANNALDEMREEIRDAGGLVVAHDMFSARAYAATLRKITGEWPIVATSDDTEAKHNIDKFRQAQSKWLVAVKMVSEGVDIPRLAIGVYATRSRTPLFFRQVVGRFVRTRKQDPMFNAKLFMPAIPPLIKQAREIDEELRHQLEIEEKEGSNSSGGAGQARLNLRTTISATNPEFTEAIYKGDGITPEEIEGAREHCRRSGIPEVYASNIAMLMREHLPNASAPESPRKADPQPRFQQERLLRSSVNKLAGRIAGKLGGGGEAKKYVNTQIQRIGFPPRNKASLEQLREIQDYLERWLGELS